MMHELLRPMLKIDSKIILIVLSLRHRISNMNLDWPIICHKMEEVILYVYPRLEEHFINGDLANYRLFQIVAPLL